MESAHEAQLLNYLKATQFEVGLLLNFGHKPQFKRMIFDDLKKNPCGSVKIRG
jgi:PD-(D/E)XK nuclease superfamily